MNIARDLAALGIEAVNTQEKIRLLQSVVGFNQLYEIYSANVATVRYANMRTKEQVAMEKAGVDPNAPLIEVVEGEKRYGISLVFTSKYSLNEYETIESVCSILNEEKVNNLIRDVEMLENILLSNAIQFFKTAPSSYQISQPELGHLVRSKKRSWSYSYGDRYDSYALRFVGLELPSTTQK